jgi:hypothetical protein
VVCSGIRFVIEIRRRYRMVPDMRSALIFILAVCALFQSGCASKPDDPDQVQLGPSIKEQRQEARKTEDFAHSLPTPRP